ncbi:MAG: glycosyltransferase family 4 protein [bacterium]|nr:glycosyltransferase family 4 protein [bacterium]
MRVCLITVGKRAQELKGLGRYESELVKCLSSKNVELKIISVGEPRRVKVWTELPRRLAAADIYHCANPDVAGSVALHAPKRLVVTFHDLIPLFISRGAYSWHAKLGSKIYVYSLWKFVACRAQKIVVVSSQTKEEVVKVFNLPEEKVEIVYNGVSEIFKPANLEKKYIIFVGNFTFRKRVDLAINVYKKLCKLIDNPPKLVLVGEFLASKHQAQFSILELIKDVKDKVIIKRKVSDEELARLYNQSYALLFTSEYEGFGLPVVEAARCKCIPFIRPDSKVPSEVKSVGVVAELNKWPELLQEIITDEKNRQQVAEKCYEQSLKFTWQEHIKKLLQIYEEVARC